MVCCVTNYIMLSTLFNSFNLNSLLKKHIIVQGKRISNANSLAIVH